MTTEKELRAIDAVLDRDNATLDRLATDPDENASKGGCGTVWTTD